MAKVTDFYGKPFGNPDAALQKPVDSVGPGDSVAVTPHHHKAAPPPGQTPPQSTPQ